MKTPRGTARALRRQNMPAFLAEQEKRLHREDVEKRAAATFWDRLKFQFRKGKDDATSDA